MHHIVIENLSVLHEKMRESAFCFPISKFESTNLVWKWGKSWWILFETRRAEGNCLPDLARVRGESKPRLRNNYLLTKIEYHHHKLAGEVVSSIGMNYRSEGIECYCTNRKQNGTWTMLLGNKLYDKNILIRVIAGKFLRHAIGAVLRLVESCNKTIKISFKFLGSHSKMVWSSRWLQLDQFPEEAFGEWTFPDWEGFRHPIVRSYWSTSHIFLCRWKIHTHWRESLWFLWELPQSQQYRVIPS